MTVSENLTLFTVFSTAEVVGEAVCGLKVLGTEIDLCISWCAVGWEPATVDYGWVTALLLIDHEELC